MAARKIMAPGACVQCGPHTGKIVAVTLRENFVGYQVAWWVNNERRFDNLSESEVIATDKTTYILVEPQQPENGARKP